MFKDPPSDAKLYRFLSKTHENRIKLLERPDATMTKLNEELLSAILPNQLEYDLSGLLVTY